MAEIRERPALTIVRRFNAAPQRVWDAITQAQALTQWLAPSDDFVNLIAETDLRVGGRYHLAMRSPEGEVHDVSGVYREVIPNRKVVFTWAWKSTPERESLVTMELRASGDGTELTLRHEQFFDEAARDRHNTGWSACLGRLERLLA